MVGPPGIGPDELAVTADAGLCPSPAATARNTRPVAAAFAASAIVHAALALLVALAVGGADIGRDAPSPSALRATLSEPPQKFVLPEPAPKQPAVEEAATALPAPSRPKALVPVPTPPPPPSEVKGSGEGRLMVQVAEAEETPYPAALAGLLRAHPGAVRVVPEFEVEPAGVYPEAALAARRQLSASILAIVHEDGRLELAPGTFEDPIFRESARAALTSAKARPPEVDGKAVKGWALLRFYYESVGPGEATASPDSAR